MDQGEEAEGLPSRQVGRLKPEASRAKARLKMATKYGWFSEKQANLFGTKLCLTSSGEKVVVSETSSIECPSGFWDDYIAVGAIEKVLGEWDENDEYYEVVEDFEIIGSKPAIIIRDILQSKDSHREWSSALDRVNVNRLFGKQRMGKD